VTKNEIIKKLEGLIESLRVNGDLTLFEFKETTQPSFHYYRAGIVDLDSLETVTHIEFGRRK
jgi:hypothetical protein